MFFAYIIGYSWMWFCITALILDTKEWKKIPDKIERNGAAFTAGMFWPFVLSWLFVAKILENE